MAIYHMQAKVVSRGSGRYAVAASTYMSCSRMYNDYFSLTVVLLSFLIYHQRHATVSYLKP